MVRNEKSLKQLKKILKQLDEVLNEFDGVYTQDFFYNGYLLEHADELLKVRNNLNNFINLIEE